MKFRFEALGGIEMVGNNLMKVPRNLAATPEPCDNAKLPATHLPLPLRDTALRCGVTDAQFIPNPRMRQDILRTRRLCLDFLSQLFHQRPHMFLLFAVLRAPNGAQQFAVRHDLVRPVRQISQNLKFFRRQVHSRPRTPTSRNSKSTSISPSRRRSMSR